MPSKIDLCYMALAAIFAKTTASAIASPESVVLPDIIQRAADDIGIDMSSHANSAENVTLDFVPPDLKAAYASGDHITINQTRQRAARDLDPIFSNIQANGYSSWINITDPVTGIPYFLSIAGDPSQPTGYMWVFSIPKNSSSEDEASSTSVMQVGTLSRNSRSLGISSQTWDNKGVETTAGILSSIAVYALTNFIKARIAQTAVGIAIRSAVAEAGTALIARGIVTEAVWLGFGAVAASTLIGAGITVVVTFLVFFIVDFAWRTYKISITVINWSGQDDYIVKDYYGDNEAIDDDQSFKSAALHKASYQVTLPTGFAVNTTDAIVTRCNYNFVNDNKLLDGVGVAMTVQRRGKPAEGFRFKYILHRFTDNELALGNNVDGSIKEYYKQDNLSPRGSTSVKGVMSDGTPITATTPSLGGRSDQFYEYIVSVGLQPKSLDESLASARTEIVSRPQPQIPLPLHAGDQVALPDGTKVTVNSVGEAGGTTSSPTPVLPSDGPAYSVAAS